MKNEQQENGVLRGPLILMVPASNLVAVISLDWLDGANRAAVSAQTHGRNYLANRPRTPKDFGETSASSFKPLSRVGFVGGVLNEAREPQEVSKEVVGIHVLLTRSLFDDGIPRKLLLPVSPAKLTSAPSPF
jgi:hypothetical protein